MNTQEITHSRMKSLLKNVAIALSIVLIIQMLSLIS